MKPQDLAKELANSIRESEEFKTWEAAKKKIAEHEAAKVMLDDFRKKQWKLEEARMAGEEITTEQQEELKKLFEIISYNPYVSEFLMAEMRMHNMVLEIQKIIASAIGVELPESGAKQEGEA